MFLRDHRTQAEADYDPKEFDLLHALMARLGRSNGVIDIVCGYRTPESNEFLRTRSAMTGVAEHSQHMLSKAIDIRVPGVSTLTLRNAALSLGAGRGWVLSGEPVCACGRGPGAGVAVWRRLQDRAWRARHRAVRLSRGM